MNECILNLHVVLSHFFISIDRSIMYFVYHEGLLMSISLHPYEIFEIPNVSEGGLKWPGVGQPTSEE
jgi:hypothetical protein